MGQDWALAMFVLVAYSLFVQNSNSTYSAVLCHAVSSVCCGPAETVNPSKPLLQPLLPMLLWLQLLLPSLVLKLVLSLIVMFLSWRQNKQGAYIRTHWQKHCQRLAGCGASSRLAPPLHRLPPVCTAQKQMHLQPQSILQQGVSYIISKARPMVKD